MSNDANHLSAPSRSGDGLAIAIDAAMAEAGVSPAILILSMHMAQQQYIMMRWRQRQYILPD